MGGPFYEVFLGSVNLREPEQIAYMAKNVIKRSVPFNILR